MRPELQKKIDFAINLLRLYDNPQQPLEIAYSGGKDSDVILQLAKEAGANFRAIYKNTTIDPPGTIRHVRENGVEIKQPKRSFFKIVQAKGFPSMFRRFCCRELKEYKILNVCATGIRTDESVRRKKLYTTFEKCRIYSKKERVRMYSPIWDWNLSDVAHFVNDRQIRLAPVYYKEDGSIDFNRRLGCLGCPMKSDRGIADFKAHPQILRALMRSAVIYSHTHTHTLRIFNNNPYDAFFCNVFCHSYGEFKIRTSRDLFGETINTKEYIEQFFNTKID